MKITFTNLRTRTES